MSVTHILLIEDNPGDARRVMEFLQVTGNIQQTTWQPTLTEGLRFLEESTSDLALLDLGLPDHSGLAAVQRLCQTHPKLPVVILTGNQQQQLAEQALQEGAQDFLCKEGLTPQVLECAIRHAIERQRLASELIALNQQIEATNLDLETAQTQVLQGEKLAAIGQLAAGVAHEINNPVGFIHSNLGTLSRYFQRLCEYHTLLDQNQTVDVLRQARRSLKIDHILADAPELIDESLQGTDRIKTIVQNLKNFSRSEGNNPIPTNLNECLETTIQIAWNEIKYKANLIRDFGELPQITCFPNQLNQVFLNLLVNAAQAIEGRGDILVRTWHDDHAVYVSVRDTGVGIAPELLQRVFEPFFTTKEAGKGTGLGLSISLDIIHKHQGELRVDSAPGDGSTFTIRLPLETC